MITENSGVFHLQNETASYLLRVRPEGFLEHLHFGAPVYTEDAQALAVRSGLGWGDSVQFDEEDNAACLDVLPLEWSGAGRGDYRESPISLSRGGEPLSTVCRSRAGEKRWSCGSRTKRRSCGCGCFMACLKRPSRDVRCWKTAVIRP